MTKRRKKVATKAYKPEPIVGSMALWVMTPFGIIMPAAVPAETAAKLGLSADILQVRARDAAHLDTFRELYCPSLGPTTATPQLDYDCRSYVSRSDLAKAMARMTLDIDAPKFKPLVDGRLGLKDGSKATALHNCYLSIWGQVCALGWPKTWSTKPAKDKGDPRSESVECQQWGHLWPPASTGRKQIKVVACQDHVCHALKDMASGQVRYPAKVTAAGSDAEICHGRAGSPRGGLSGETPDTRSHARAALRGIRGG